jgi:hypothetical protein
MILGDQRLEEEHGVVIASVELVQDVKLSVFRDAFDRVRVEGTERGALFSEEPADGFNPSSASVIQGVRLDVVERRLILFVRTYEWPYDDPDEEHVKQVLRPLLAPYRATVEWFEEDDWTGSDGQLAAAIHVPVRARTVGQVVRLGRDCRALLTAVRTGRLTPQTVEALLAAGHGHTLVGQVESTWLEAKSAPYRVELEPQKLELAKDVAAMANAAGGIIVIGAHTSGRTGDRIGRVSEVPLEMVNERRWRNILNSRVLPPLEDVRFVGAQPGAERGLVAIVIPPQRDALKPFVVRGAADGSAISGHHLSVPVRDGEDTYYVEPAALQHQLSAGRAALRAERDVAAVRAEMQQLRADLTPRAPGPPSLRVGSGSGSGALYFKPSGEFVVWLHNAGEQAAEIADALLDFGSAKAEPSFHDGLRIGPDEQLAIWFEGLRDATPLERLLRLDGKLRVVFGPVGAPPSQTLELTLRPGLKPRQFVGETDPRSGA